MRIMISYTREDRSRVEMLVEGLRRMGHEPWYDSSLHTGENWWNTILSKIASADAVLLALSPTFLASKACAAERSYAVATHRPLLPVMMGRVEPSVLPVELAGRHILDYVQPSERTVFDLVSSLNALPLAPPPPRPLPPAPPVPLSYLNTVSDRIGQPSLDLDEQLSIVARLSDGLRSGDAEERHGARQLLETLSRRGLLYDQPAAMIRSALAAAPPPSDFAPLPVLAATTPAPRSSTVVRVLAAIGAVVVALVVLGIVVAVNRPAPVPEPTSACLVDPDSGLTFLADPVTRVFLLDAAGNPFPC